MAPLHGVRRTAPAAPALRRAPRLPLLLGALVLTLLGAPGARADEDVALVGVRLSPGTASPGQSRVTVEARLRNGSGGEVGGEGWSVTVRAVSAPDDAGDVGRFVWSVRPPRVEPREARDVPAITFTAPETPGAYRLEVVLLHRERAVGRPEPVGLDVAWEQDAAIETVRLEATPDPGEKLVVSVTARNRGRSTWSPRARLQCRVVRTLSGSAPAGEQAFARLTDPVGRVVAPGDAWTFETTVEAPRNQPVTGVWELGFVVVDGEKGTTPLGAEKVQKVTVAGELNLEVRRIQVEARLTPKRSYRVYVTLKNTGTVRWEGRDYVLSCDNVARPRNVAHDDRFAFQAPLDRDVDVGAEVTLDGTLVAPVDPGDWTLRVTFARAKEAFGDPVEREVEVVAVWNAQILDVRMDLEPDAGRLTDLLVKVKNLGPSTWFDDDVALQCRVVKTHPGSDASEGRKAYDFSVLLSASRRIDAAETVDVSTRRTAPREAGTWDVELQMVQGRTAFGQPVRRTVTVR